MSAVDELVLGERRGRWMVAAVACAALLALTAAPAMAAVAVIPGNPLTIYANDNGQLQVMFGNGPTGEFFPSGATPANAGLNIAVQQIGTSAPRTDLQVFGFGAYDPELPAPTVTGNGTAASPYTLTARFSAGGNIHIVETLTYVNGTTDVGVRYSIVAFDNTVHGRLYEAADLYVSGDDQGVGFVGSAPPQVGGINQAAGSSARLVQITPWQHFQEAYYDNVFSVIRSTTDTGAPNLSDTVDPSLVNNGVGVQWNFENLDANTPQVFETMWRFKHFTPLALSLVAATRAEGQNATVTVAAQNGDGNPDPGRTIRYTINGANPGLGSVVTGADGRAAISWTGAFQGTDTLTAFTDLNNNGVPDRGEPTQTVSVTFTPPPPPVPGKSVVAKVVSGTVLVKYPPGYVPRATSPSSGFVPFNGAANVPVGTQFNTVKGRVALTSAADTGGAKTQTSDFYAGIFQVKQSVPKKKPKKPKALITDLVMKGQIARSQCAPLKGARAAAVDAKKKKKKGPKSVLGKLWGSGKGKFRTDGKYSSATVRGTIWLVQDECDGTLTKVKRGVVSVRDIKRKKTVKVKAGHSYLARAVTSKSRRKKK